MIEGRAAVRVVPKHRVANAGRNAVDASRAA